MTIQSLIDSYNDYTRYEFGDAPITLDELNSDEHMGVLGLVYTTVGTEEDREIWVSYDTDSRKLLVDLYDAPMVTKPMSYQEVADMLDWDTLLNEGLTLLHKNGVEVE